MNSSKIQYCLAACACVVAFMFAAVAGASDIAEVTNKACTKCHSSKRICLNLGVKSGPAWKENVAKMVTKGAKIPKDRVEEAAMYLAGLEPGSTPLCD